MQCAAKVCSKSDLSMVNLQQRALVELTAVVTQLSPDILVLFAGNNWALRSPSFPDVGVADVAPAVSALRADGVAGLGRMARQRTAKAARRSIDAIAAIADAWGTGAARGPSVGLRAMAAGVGTSCTAGHAHGWRPAISRPRARWPRR